MRYDNANEDHFNVHNTELMPTAAMFLSTEHWLLP